MALLNVEQARSSNVKRDQPNSKFASNWHFKEFFRIFPLIVLFEKVKKKEVVSCIMEMNYIQVEYLSMLSPVHCLHSSRIFVYVKSCSLFTFK
jgi:hypothetical protein